MVVGVASATCATWGYPSFLGFEDGAADAAAVVVVVVDAASAGFAGET